MKLLLTIPGYPLIPQIMLHKLLQHTTELKHDRHVLFGQTTTLDLQYRLLHECLFNHGRIMEKILLIGSSCKIKSCKDHEFDSNKCSVIIRISFAILKTNG